MLTVRTPMAFAAGFGFGVGFDAGFVAANRVTARSTSFTAALGVCLVIAR